MAEDEILQGKRPTTLPLAHPERDGLELPLHVESSRAPDAFGMNPEDGMPQQIPAVAFKDSLAPHLEIDRFICMADTREFVVRDRVGTIRRRFPPDQVQRADDGRYFYRSERSWWWLVGLGSALALVIGIGSTQLGLLAEPAGATTIAYMVIVLLSIPWIRRRREVFPIRPKCEHYMRQLIPWPDNPDMNRCQRLCGALKNDQGELYNVGDTTILACELRNPRHAETESLIDHFDQRVVSAGAEAKKDELDEFDIDAALSAEGEDLGVLGGPK